MQEILTGLGILLILIFWKYVWCPTVLDWTRDQLFDIRDIQLRQYFLNKGLSLDDPMYKRLRDFLNRYLRYTESATLWEYIYQKNNSQHIEEYNEQLVESFFYTDNEELRDQIRKIRFRSSMVLLIYMAATSIFFMGISFFIFPLWALKRVWIPRLPKLKFMQKARHDIEKLTSTC